MADQRPVPAEHERHDVELIARVAAGDGSPADVQAAVGLLASCPACALVDSDLRAISAGVRALGRGAVVLPAPRDFRISAADAARLRRRGPRAWLAQLGLGVSALPTRVGGGLVAIGFVGLLFGSGILGAPINLGSGAGGSAPALASSSARPAASGASAPAVPAQAASAKATDDRKGIESFAAGLFPAPTTALQATNEAAAAASAPTAAPTAAIDAMQTQQAPTAGRGNTSVLLLSGAAIAFGLALVLATWPGRRAGP